MVLPFIPRLVQDRDAADGEFADGPGEGGLGSDGEEEGVPFLVLVGLGIEVGRRRWWYRLGLGWKEGSGGNGY